MNDGGQIWRMRADGSGPPQQLSEHPAFYTDIAYSLDGTRIVGLRGNEYVRHQTFSEFGGLRLPLDLVWLPAEGGNVELVVPGARCRRATFLQRSGAHLRLLRRRTDLASIRRY